MLTKKSLNAYINSLIIHENVDLNEVISFRSKNNSDLVYMEKHTLKYIPIIEFTTDDFNYESFSFGENQEFNELNTEYRLEVIKFLLFYTIESKNNIIYKVYYDQELLYEFNYDECSFDIKVLNCNRYLIHLVNAPVDIKFSNIISCTNAYNDLFRYISGTDLCYCIAGSYTMINNYLISSDNVIPTRLLVSYIRYFNIESLPIMCIKSRLVPELRYGSFSLVNGSDVINKRTYGITISEIRVIELMDILGVYPNYRLVYIRYDNKYIGYITSNEYIKKYLIIV